jgi:hypothetical protein
MKRLHVFMTAFAAAILLSLPVSTAEAFWGWGGFGFSFGFGSGWYGSSWYRPWYHHYGYGPWYHRYLYPYRWRHGYRRWGFLPYYGYPVVTQPTVEQTAESETPATLEK